ncbi:MAG: radical SAM protein [Candidatus Njordarchaeales archaeon]
MVEYAKSRVRTIMAKSKLYGVDYAINPYIGCEHGCVYCYARFVYISMGKDPLEWGKRVVAKANAVELLKREVVRNRRGVVLISSVTDPYQPLERREFLTRRILEVLHRYGYPVVILTKSDLVLRDIDLFKKFSEIEVGLTITSLNDDVREIFEPMAPKPENRIRALKMLVKEGIRTYALIGPLLPLFVDKEIDSLLETLADIGVGRILVDKLNLKAKNWVSIHIALRNNLDPHTVSEFWRAARSTQYFLSLKKKITRRSKELGLQIDFCY